ncbi:hypothetical protein XVE_3688 [Xanthomonas vesicatoria ATCC 35937]|uniref:Uncharacterized protein n=1 Tax=Xanthomonas vesicatoria ATCC 35937 TaxID=925775 RepID=F0BHF3_9XANT|nr:hypothetical protein XVE_4685 [Xanthomonas vesicatoria ATCC 35937]EGD07627.1 hypothetical protein XVE_4163 [Xanthomonas vesicatoria ATCC 35937]EGD08095.1 hypothetical protein XVE_3688 [Xanthomonas vesicatoria ATCC 35937]
MNTAALAEVTVSANAQARGRVQRSDTARDGNLIDSSL